MDAGVAEQAWREAVPELVPVRFPPDEVDQDGEPELEAYFGEREIGSFFAIPAVEKDGELVVDERDAARYVRVERAYVRRLQARGLATAKGHFHPNAPTIVADIERMLAKALPTSPAPGPARTEEIPMRRQPKEKSARRCKACGASDHDMRTHAKVVGASNGGGDGAGGGERPMRHTIVSQGSNGAGTPLPREVLAAGDPLLEQLVARHAALVTKAGKVAELIRELGGTVEG